MISWKDISLEMIPTMMGALVAVTGLVAWGLDMNQKLYVGLLLGGLSWMAIVIIIGAIRRMKS